MSDETKAPKDRFMIFCRIRPYGLALASVVLIVLVVWGALTAVKLFPQLPDWEILLGIALAAGFALAALWIVPHLQVNKVIGLSPKERFDSINEARKTLLQILGGVLVLAGLYSTLQSLNLARQSFSLSQEGQNTDRFSKAVEELGAVDSAGRVKLEGRLHGIYVLQHIANVSEEDHWPIMEILTAYIRGNAPITRQGSRESAATGIAPDVTPTMDIQAALTVLGTRDVESEHGNHHLNLRQTDVNGAFLSGADLSGADLSGAYLIKAHLSGAHLMNANLRDARLMNADLDGANLNGAHLSKADLSRAQLYHADLSRVDLGEAHLIGANLLSAHLSVADLGRADLSGANLSGADLNNADLSGANLSKADLSRADLNSADLKETDFSGANLSEVNLLRADLRGANLTTARNLDQQQIDSAKGDRRTRLPADKQMPEAWKAPFSPDAPGRPN